MGRSIDLQSSVDVPIRAAMEFTTCPYDGTDIDAEDYSGGSVLLRCDHCGAAWEWHNAWIRRVSEPDRERVRAAGAERLLTD
jgi:hypothetical protein